MSLYIDFEGLPIQAGTENREDSDSIVLHESLDLIETITKGVYTVGQHWQLAIKSSQHI